MAMNVTQKILAAHLVSGTLEAGSPIAIRIDQTLTQDATTAGRAGPAASKDSVMPTALR